MIAELIGENSFEAVHKLLMETKNKYSNARNNHNIAALSLATKTLPPHKAVYLIDALMKAGATLPKRDNERRHALLFACEAGVDPVIFDALLKWNVIRNDVLGNWWNHVNISKNGVFILACMSGNYTLAEHILKTVLKYRLATAEDFLFGRSNHILKGLLFAVENHGQNDFCKILGMCDNIIDYFPEEYDNFDEDQETGTSIYLSGILTHALEREMYTAVLDYSAYFSVMDYSQYNCNLMGRVVWKLIARNPFVVLPKNIIDLSLSYERNGSWEKNKDLALVLLRAYKNTAFADILGCISSFIYWFALDKKALIVARDIASVPWVGDTTFYDSDGDYYYDDS